MFWNTDTQLYVCIVRFVKFWMCPKLPTSQISVLSWVSQACWRLSVVMLKELSPLSCTYVRLGSSVLRVICVQYAQKAYAWSTDLGSWSSGSLGYSCIARAICSPSGAGSEVMIGWEAVERNHNGQCGKMEYREKESGWLHTTLQRSSVRRMQLRAVNYTSSRQVFCKIPFTDMEPLINLQLPGSSFNSEYICSPTSWLQQPACKP